MLTRVSVAAERAACSAIRLSNKRLLGAPRGVPRSSRRLCSGTPSGDLGRTPAHVEGADQTTAGRVGVFWTGANQAVAFLGGLATIGLVAVGYQQFRLEQERTEREARERDVVNAVLSASVREEELHLSRAIDQQLRGLVFKYSRSIYVVVGPRGAGKSQAIRAAVHGQPGAILVKMKGSDKLEERIAALLRARGASKATPDDVYTMLQQVIAAKRAEPGHPVDWVPTLVIEVDQQFPISEIDALMNAAKDLGPDQHLCVPFVIFSDMRATFAFDGMGGRVQHIPVSDLTMEEVEQLAEVVRSAGTLHASMTTPEQRREFVKLYGPRVGLLVPALARGPDAVKSTAGAWLADALELWQCTLMPEQQADVRALLRALARKYQQAKVEAEASGRILRVNEIAITSEETGMTPRRLARIMSQLGKAHVVQAYDNRFVFVSPVAAERVLELMRKEQEQERLELERKESARPWYQKLFGLH